MKTLDQLAAEGKLHAFTLWPTPDGGYQANLQAGKAAGWRVRRGSTPSDAIEAVLAMDYVDAIDDRSGVNTAPFVPTAPAEKPEPGIFD